MCGITGIIGRVSDHSNRLALERMERALEHRGPDANGVWVSDADADGFGCLLAHRRLKILDLSSGASQPMADPVTGHVIVFNGEIYNYVDLRQQMLTEGEAFESTGDTAVLLRLLSRRGYQAVDQLRGMFAFGLWNARQRELLVARDPLGIKPLYLCRNPDHHGAWSILFASEVRAILASGLLGTPRLDPEAIASVLWNGFVMGPGTAVCHVEALDPGEMRRFDRRGRESARKTFWNLEAKTNLTPISEEVVSDAIRESVRLHLASDVPLGVFLSGGVDSSAVANLAQKASHEQISTFTLVFEHKEFSEGEYARRVAEAIGTNHREILLSESTFVDNVDAAIDTLDQPTFDGLNSFYMSKAVREAGLTVALVGTGGDELFGGYSSFRDLPRLHALANASRWLPTPAKVALAQALAFALRPTAGTGANVGAQTRWAKLPEMVRSGTDLLRLYQLAYALFLPEFQHELISDGIVDNPLMDGLSPSLREHLARETSNRSPLSAIAVLEQRCFLGERLLRDTDAASMAVSLEVRLPLVDQVVVEQVNCLADDARFSPILRKAILRRIGLEGLDPNLFERPKSGFVLPYDRWIRRDLRKPMEEMMRDERLAAAVGLNGGAVARLWNGFQSGQGGLYWSRVWAVYVLMRWCHRNGVFI